MEANPPKTVPGTEREARLRLANAVVLFLNSVLLFSLCLYGGIWVAQHNIGEVVVPMLMLVGIGLAFKLCDLPHSYALGHALLFIYIFSAFLVLVPFALSHLLPQLGVMWRHLS